jgi:DNA mismatch endonuclease, patch repair protein
VEKLLKQTLPDGRFLNVSVKRSRSMSAVKSKNNSSTERLLRMALVRSRISGWVTHANLPGKPDIYFPKEKLAIFLDGCFWHGCSRCGHIPKTNTLFWETKIKRNRQRDQKNSRLLKGQGILVIRAWEHSLQKSRNLALLLDRITEATGRGTHAG